LEILERGTGISLVIQCQSAEAGEHSRDLSLVWDGFGNLQAVAEVFEGFAIVALFRIGAPYVQQRHRNQLLIAQALRNIQGFLQVIPRLVVSLLVAGDHSEIAQRRGSAGRMTVFLRDLLHQTKAQGRGGKFASRTVRLSQIAQGGLQGSRYERAAGLKKRGPARLGGGFNQSGRQILVGVGLLFRSGSAGHRNREKPAEQAANQKPRGARPAQHVSLDFNSHHFAVCRRWRPASGLVAYLIRSRRRPRQVRRAVAHQR